MERGGPARRLHSAIVSTMPTARPVPELLAPAGDWSALEAALEAGADAVYFGLGVLNARRRARNFSPEELARAVAAVHARSARAYLTLNTDIAQRELGQAARILELARQCHVDAVLVRDPALLALRPEYPELEFHFSTQTCMANSADVAAAGALGASRVVLARELTLNEIAAACAVSGVQAEVFVQGALCFCISGRCLLSSWVGGRSGNRGTCTSPCRVPWSAEGRPAGTPLSMRDLATLDRLDELRRAGVAALKIEGRLKSADWVRRAVSLYHRALRGENPETLVEEALPLGAYTGRAFTCGYLDGLRDELTGASGRESSQQSWEDQEPGAGLPTEDAATYALEINVGTQAITCCVQCGPQRSEWSMPKTVVRRLHKARPVSEVLAQLAAAPIQGVRLAEGRSNEPGYLLVPRAANALVDRIGAALRQARKSRDRQVPVDLRPTVRAALQRDAPCPANRRTLGQTPDRARLEPSAVRRFVEAVRPEAILVEGVTAAGLEDVLSASAGVPVLAALPEVFFEHEVAAIRELIQRCVHLHVTVEVNSWGGWHLAREAGARWESGPGLPVLNAMAARMLAQRGAACVTLSREADRRQLEEIAACCPVACSLVVFGRPALMVSRVRLPDALLGPVLSDRRGTRMTARIERGLCTFRPVEPYDLRGQRNARIRVAHLVVDLVGSPDPVAEWESLPGPGQRRFSFNYDRVLA